MSIKSHTMSTTQNRAVASLFNTIQTGPSSAVDIEGHITTASTMMTSTVAPIPECPPRDSPDLDILRSALTQINRLKKDDWKLKPLVEQLATAESLNAGITFLDLHASELFPHSWRPSKSRSDYQLRNPPRNVKKANRRRQYGAVQRLIHHNKKDADKAVLLGNWRELYKADPTIPHNVCQY